MTAMILVIILRAHGEISTTMLPADIYSSQSFCDMNLRPALNDLGEKERKILGDNADYWISGACVKARAAGPQ